ncbi:MAG: 50S ribosomal protein L3 [Verrucomicrobia bacterium]|nr:MAG: 50S ribosomal protein L3 [Verrucomicrobiota bacterium]
MQAIIGKKIGMTQVYDDQGVHVPVTVLQVGPCVVVQVKTVENEGYGAAQLGFGERKAKNAGKAQEGHCKKAGQPVQRVLREVALDAGEAVKVGDTVGAALFKDVGFVDVIGITKGRGFQGVVKRHGFRGGPAAHGHTSHRRPGSIGNRTWPSRVFKNRRMGGHMGFVRMTQQNLKIVQVRESDNVILVRGAVPGPTGSILLVRKAIKKAAKK